MGPEYLYLGFVLLVQLGGIIYWASSLGARVKQIEKDVSKITSEVDAINKLEIRISMVEVLLGTQNEILKEIKDEIKNRIYNINVKD